MARVLSVGVVDVLVIGVGVVLMAVLSQASVDRSLRLADHINVTGTFVGLTVLSVGTSLPEIATHIAGSVHILREPDRLDDLSGLVIGGNVGSDIFQQNLALPLIALVGGVIVARRDEFAEIGGLIAASVVVLLVGLGGEVTRLEGVGLVVLYGIYLWQLYVRRVGGTPERPERLPAGAARRILSSLAVGVVLLAVVAALVLRSAERLVRRHDLSASFLGVVTLGVAAAMPELVTSVAAARRRERGAAAGILIGSNVTNPLLALGTGAAISGYSVPTVVLAYDLPVKIGTAGLLAILFFRRSTLGRGPALTLIALYALYLAGRLLLFPDDVVAG